MMDSLCNHTDFLRTVYCEEIFCHKIRPLQMALQEMLDLLNLYFHVLHTLIYDKHAVYEYVHR